MKKKLVIWGGWWGQNTPISLNNINSHASVTAYFLTKYLSEFYHIVNIYDFYSALEILNHNDAVACLSTFQSGFTRLSQKGKKDIFNKIRKNFRGRICSIIDDAYRMNYNEDILFTVKPKRTALFLPLRKVIDKDLYIERVGWPAEPDICYPEAMPDNEIHVFIDHSWYTGGMDCSRLYFYVFKNLVRAFPAYKFHVYRQNNDGIVEWDFQGKYDEPLFLRSRKVPYLEMLRLYRRCHFFCVTHPESAGLAAIEAAMCGAKLIVPKFFGRSFISQDLLNDGVAYSHVRLSKRRMLSGLRKEILRGTDRMENREKILLNNTWRKAAFKIHRVISENA